MKAHSTRAENTLASLALLCGMGANALNIHEYTQQPRVTRIASIAPFDSAMYSILKPQYSHYFERNAIIIAGVLALAGYSLIRKQHNE